MLLIPHELSIFDTISFGFKGTSLSLGVFYFSLLEYRLLIIIFS